MHIYPPNHSGFPINPKIPSIKKTSFQKNKRLSIPSQNSQQISSLTKQDYRGSISFEGNSIIDFSKFIKHNNFKIEMNSKNFLEKEEKLKQGKDALARINIENLLLNKEISVVMEIPFDQDNFVIKRLKELVETKEEYEELNKLVLKFDGLCEIICNKMLMEDLLGKGHDPNFLREKLHVDELNVDSVKKSHILKIHSFFALLISYLFGIYPDNLFSIADQWNLLIKGKEGNEVNKEILLQGLSGVKDGENIKISIFKKENLSFSGHSLLIKKVAHDNYIFFDPNTGEKRGLSFENLCEQLNQQVKDFNGQDIYFCKGSDYLRRLQDLRIIEEAESIRRSAAA